jgi:hypothetical protein
MFKKFNLGPVWLTQNVEYRNFSKSPVLTKLERLCHKYPSHSLSLISSLHGKFASYVADVV